MPYSDNAFESFVQNLTFSEKLALYVTRYVGTMGFVYILMFFIFTWIIFNFLFSYPFDSKDFFILFSFITVVDFLLMPFILVGQNLISKFNEKKENVDFDRNKNIELHLLKMEIMLNRLLPESEKRTIEIGKNIQNIEETVSCISEQFSDDVEEEINSSNNINNVFLRNCVGDMKFNSMIVIFNPKYEDKILYVLNEIKSIWSIVLLPPVLDIEGNKMITFLYDPQNEKEINKEIQELLEENDFHVKWKNND
jgi:uncharacterized membrane protein